MEGQQLEQDIGQHYTLQRHFYKMFIEKWRGSNLNKTWGNITLYNVISIKCL